VSKISGKLVEERTEEPYLTPLRRRRVSESYTDE
jgi:hypothetical protein